MYIEGRLCAGHSDEDLRPGRERKIPGFSLHGASSMFVNTYFESVAPSKKSAMKREG